MGHRLSAMAAVCLKRAWHPTARVTVRRLSPSARQFAVRPLLPVHLSKSSSLIRTFAQQPDPYGGTPYTATPPPPAEGRSIGQWITRLLKFGLIGTGTVWWLSTVGSLLLLVVQDPDQLLHELQEEEKEEQMLSKFYGVGSHTMTTEGCVACNEMELKEQAVQDLYNCLCRMQIVRSQLGEQPLMRLCHAPLSRKETPEDWPSQLGNPLVNKQEWRACVGLESRVRDKGFMIDFVFTFDRQQERWVATAVELWEQTRGEQCLGAAQGQLPHGIAYCNI